MATLIPEINTLMQGFEIIKQNSYLVIFILMIIEGPLVSAAAAFAASMGYFNVYLILLLSFLGCFIPDLVYFYIGKRGSKPLLKKLEKKYGKERIKKLTKSFHKNKNKTLVAVKLTPFASIPGIILSGLMDIKTKTFILISTLVTLAISGVMVFTGYYFGVMFNEIAEYLNLFTGIVVLIIVASIAYPLIFRKLKELKKLF